MTGLSRQVIESLVAELAPRWRARHRDRLAAQARRRAIGGGGKHRFGFSDRLLATLVHLRHRMTHDVLAARFGVRRSTTTRSIDEVRPFWPSAAAEWMMGSSYAPSPTWSPTSATTPGRSWTPPKYASADQPRAGPVGTGSYRGKARLNTMKALVICDPIGKLCSAARSAPGRCTTSPRPVPPGSSTSSYTRRSASRSSPTPATRD